MSTSTKSNRGIRRSAEETRQAILAAARQRLAEFGPDGLRLTEVAKLAGVTHPLVMHYFGNRQGLVDALVADTGDRLVQRLAHLLDPPGGARPSFADIVGTALSQITSDGEVDLILLAAKAQPERARATFEGIFAKLVDEAHEMRLRFAPPGLDPVRLKRDTARIVAMTAWLIIGEGALGPIITRACGLTSDEEPDRVRLLFSELVLRRLTN